MTFDRITIDLAAMAVRRASEVCAVPVATVVAMIEDGMSPEEILDNLPYLERANIHEALRFNAGQPGRDGRHTL